MMETCDACIDGACEELEAAGWTRQSVKVIGACGHSVAVYGIS